MAPAWTPDEKGQTGRGVSGDLVLATPKVAQAATRSLDVAYRPRDNPWMVESLGQLFIALSEDFSRLIDTKEADWVEFKTSPYPLDQPPPVVDKIRWELAKDVAAFANVAGGVIVIGVRTEEIAQEAADVAREIRLVPKSLVDAQKYRDTIAKWSYPSIRNLNVRWHPSPDPDEGLWTIEIPNQPEASKPFVVRSMYTEAGRIAHAFGVPRRDGDRVSWMPPEEAHRLLLDGQRAANLSLEPSGTWQAAQGERADLHLSSIYALDGWRDVPVYALQAIPPTGPALLPGFFSSKGIAGVLRDPPSLRPHIGFNLNSGTAPKVEGSGLTVLGNDSIALLVDRDGLFTAAASGPFLGWGMNPEGRTDPRLTINPVALVEFTLEFCRFVYHALVPAAGTGPWRFRVVCRNFQQPRPVALPPYASVDRTMAWLKQKTASQPAFEVSVTGSGDAGRDAFEILRHVYGLFGFAEEQIPFASDGTIDGDRIRVIGR